MDKRRNRYKLIIRYLIIGLVFMNVVAMFHAYKFTHFVSDRVTKTNSPEKLNATDKLKALLFGINNPRPKNKQQPLQYIDLKLHSNKVIDCWYHKQNRVSPKDTVKGTVILFHGYSGNKSLMLDKAEVFEQLHYNVLLVDFMGSGGSEGCQTTIGFKEAEEVKTAFDYLTQQGEQNIYLFGTSMGSAAIMKAIADFDINPKAIIIECPFGTMYQTTCARFKNMNAPPFPMAALLVFWGGVENGFWAFGHNPAQYAHKIKCPTLLLYGEQDKNVSREEIDEIYHNLKGKKILQTFALAGHDNYMLRYKNDWINDVHDFLNVY